MTILDWIIVIVVVGVALVVFACLRAAGRASRAEERMERERHCKMYMEKFLEHRDRMNAGKSPRLQKLQAPLVGVTFDPSVVDDALKEEKP